MTRKQALIELRNKVKAGPYATMGHTILCQRAFPKPVDFDGSREAYAKSDAQMAILAWRNDDLNAAKALHDAVLPGWGWEVSNEDTAAVFYGNSFSGPCKISAADTPARAWLLAILEALIAQEPDT